MKTILLSFLLLSVNFSFAQYDDGLYIKDGENIFYARSYGTHINLGEKNSITVNDKNVEIENHKGSPLLYRKWQKAYALFNDGKMFKFTHANYDALSDHIVVYLQNMKQDIEGLADKKLPLINLLNESLVRIRFKGEKGEHSFIRLSTSDFSEKPKTSFFEYYTTDPDKIYVVKSYTKFIAKSNETINVAADNNGKPYIFKGLSAYYIKNKNGTFVPARLSRRSVLKLLGDKHKKELKQYIKTEKLNMSHPEDVQKLLVHYYEKYGE